MLGPSLEQEPVGGRYRVEARLGRGGMAEVFRVYDTGSGQTRALKRLHVPEGPLRDRAIVLFAREYQVLSELSHPHVVRVYDYGVDADGPYYVMELVTGPGLQAQAPMPWKAAAAVLRDLAASLSLLHARRLVHGDLTPANVCLDDAGRAKLIDFGTMASFGPCTHTMGTPAYAAPELLHGQRVDARTDLYALGALAYFLVGGRNAYPARDFRELRDLWRSRPMPVDQLAPDAPQALTQLIRSMLSLDPAARPESAAEVLQRLQVAAALPELDIDYSQAFLSTPPLLGRDEARTSFRKRMIRAMRGRGGALLVQGPAGSGRSRLLESHVLEGKLVGALVVRASAADCGQQAFATMLALLLECREAAPEFFQEMVGPHLPILGHLSSLLQPPDEAPYELVEAAGPDAMRRSIHRALVRLFIGIARNTCLLIVVDDVDLSDAASAAVLAELASQGPNGRLALVASALDEPRPGSDAGPTMTQLTTTGARLQLRPLSSAQTSSLLRAVFGNVDGVPQLTQWVYGLTHGNPGRSLQLARYLVDGGVAKLQAGRWQLPEDLAPLRLPASFEATLSDALRRLPPTALAVGRLVALCEPLFPLGLQHFQQLASERGDNVLAAIEHLRRAEILALSGGHYRFERESQRRAILGQVPPDTLSALHRQLAAAYDACCDGHAIVAHHLQLAGDLDAAFSRLGRVPTDPGRQGRLSRTTRFFRSHAGIELVRFALAHAEATGRSRERLYHYRAGLLSLAFADPSLSVHAPAVLAQLRHDVGLVYADTLSPELGQDARMQAMLDEAQRVYDAADPRERCLAPVPALAELGTTVMSLCATYARCWTVDRFAALEAMVAPFAGISPAMALVHDTARMCVIGVVMGSDSRALRTQLYAATREPVSGLPEPVRRTANLTLAYYLGIDEAIAGNVAALDFVDLLESAPGHTSLASEVRLLMNLAQGDFDRARESRARRDLYALQEPHQQQLALGPLWEATLHYRVGDVMAVRALQPHLRAQAARFPGWQPWCLLVEAMYQMLHHDFDAAETTVQEGLSLVAPGQHAAWPQLAVAAIETALGREDYAAALERTRGADTTLASLGIETLAPAPLAAAGALALAHAAHFTEANARVEAALSGSRGRRSAGVQPSLLHEANARIALLQGDSSAFERAARRVAAEYRPGQHPGLLARYERLMADAAVFAHRLSPELARAADLDGDERVQTLPTFATTLQTLLGACRGPEDRAKTALEMLVERTGTTGGYLYVARGGIDPELSARIDAPPPDATRRERVRAFFEHALGGASAPDAPEEGDAGDDPYAPYLLWSRRDSGVHITGVALLSGIDGGAGIPWELLAALSDALLDAGDAIPPELP